jgi:hypothetical protein
VPATTTSYTLGGITFNNSVPDADGVVWYATLKGWNAVPMRQQFLDRVGQGGQILVESHPQSRLLTLAGVGRCTTLVAYWAARNRLENDLNFDVVDGTLVVNEIVPKQASVRRTGEPLIERMEDDYDVEFSLAFVAVDPRKYATAATATVLA